MPSDYKPITAHNEKQLGEDTASRKTQVSMYSDSTHFVYEVLQNADDYGATQVCFTLSNNEIVIEHNGKPFTEKNVEAITYFGKSTSRDDLVKTGCFGVGFKSVFAFTATPIIISGNEHFQIYGLYRIREYPYPDGFSRCWTRIVLPFNHESEQPDFVEKLMRREEAYTQISKCLSTLNMDTLLFTQNIQEIRWEIDNHSAYYRREDKMDNNVRFTTITDGREENKYVVFSKVPKWEHQAYKAVEIAFAVDTQDQLSSIDNDSLYVLFRTEEKTGLKFILNGPYRTNPARETISKSDDFNLHLMKVTCELMKESLPYLRDKKRLTVEFLSVLPNQEDAILEFYAPLREIIVDEFRNEKLTPTKRGDYEAASRLYQDQSGRGLSSLIQDEDLATLLGKDKALPLWVANTPQLTQKRDEKSGRYVQDTYAQRRNNRIENFLSMLDIDEWTVGNLVEALKPHSNIVLEWLKEKPDTWHQDLYALLGDSTTVSGGWHLLIDLKRMRIVQCSDGIYRAGRECHFLSDDVDPDVDFFSATIGVAEEIQLQIQEEDGHEENFYYVAKSVYSSGQNYDQQKKAREFLDTIGVSEVDETERIKMILKQRYTGKSIKSREADLERFIKLVEADPIKAELFKTYPIFQIDRDLDNKRWGASPAKIFLDSPYLETGLTTYYETIKEGSKRRWALSLKYTQSDIEPKRLGKFAEAVGVQKSLEPCKHEIPHDHPERCWLMDAPGGRLTNTSINHDYSIPEFEILYDEPSIDRAKLIWRTMYYLPERYLKATFRWNQSNELREAHSNLVHCLKETKWVPQKDGNLISFVFPREASIERLPGGFQYDAGQAWLGAVEFGRTAREHSSERTQRNQKAKDLGFDSSDDAEKWANLAQDLKENGISVDDVKSTYGFKNTKTNPEFPESPVKNPDYRATKIDEELENSPVTEFESHERSVRSNAPREGARVWLKAEYTNNQEQMICQICQDEMPFKKRNGEYYFEAVEAVNKEQFPIEHERQFLALCPECAARYKEFIKEDKNAMQEMINQLMASEECQIPLPLGELNPYLRFVEKHWQDIKQILKKSSRNTSRQ